MKIKLLISFLFGLTPLLIFVLTIFIFDLLSLPLNPAVVSFSQILIPIILFFMWFIKEKSVIYIVPFLLSMFFSFCLIADLSTIGENPDQFAYMYLIRNVNTTGAEKSIWDFDAPECFSGQYSAAFTNKSLKIATFYFGGGRLGCVECIKNLFKFCHSNANESYFEFRERLRKQNYSIQEFQDGFIAEKGEICVYSKLDGDIILLAKISKSEISLLSELIAGGISFQQFF